MTDYYIGLMSGTSMDSIDAALVDFSSRIPALTGHLAVEWPDNLRTRLLALAANPDSPLSEFGTLDVEAGHQFASAVIDLLKKSGLAADNIKAIGSHGQTVLHKPEPPAAFSLQIGDPNCIAEQTGITTVADFRRRDMAAGGQGAPLTPAFHNQIFRSADENRVVLNIGGMSNITVLPRTGEGEPVGFDTGPGNVLLDAWIGRQTGQSHDQDGHWARSGSVDSALLDALLAESFFRQPAPKSTGRELFNLDWLQGLLADQPRLKPENVQATLVAVTVTAIAEAIRRYANKTQTILVCGGGVHNTYMMEQLQASLPGLTIESTAQYGMHPDWVEAIAFAWFAKQALEKKPANLPSVTGASQPVILGGIYAA